MNCSNTTCVGPEQPEGPRWLWIIAIVVISLLFLTVTAVGEIGRTRIGTSASGERSLRDDPLEMTCASVRS